MADEVAVGVNAETEEQKPVNPEESEVVKPVEGDDADPQRDENEGEAEHERKRKGGWQRKIERLETEREFLMQELLKQRNSQPEPKPKEETPSVPTKEPKPEDFDLGDGTYDVVKFTDARVEWRLAQKEAAIAKTKEQETQKTEGQKLVENWQKHISVASEKYDDWDEALKVPVFPSDDPKKNAFMQREVMRSEFAGDLAYYLAKHPEETRELGTKSEYEIARAFGRIEAQFAKEESAKPEKEEAKELIPAQPVTKAPKPASPITKTATVVSTIDPRSPDSDKLPPDEWLRRRTAQTKGK